jgi:hypothetical protein
VINRIQIVRILTALTLVIALCGFSFANAATACPLLKAKAPCCPKTQTQKNHCQKSASLKTCPFTLTEGTQAIVKAKVKSSPIPQPAVLTSPVELFHPVPVASATASAPAVDLFLLHRILLI